jgi:hypothetical protein
MKNTNYDVPEYAVFKPLAANSILGPNILLGTLLTNIFNVFWFEPFIAQRFLHVRPSLTLKKL